MDSENGKVVHVNFVPEAIRTKGLTGQAWATSISEVLGGKVIILLIVPVYNNEYFYEGWRERRKCTRSRDRDCEGRSSFESRGRIPAKSYRITSKEIIQCIYM